MSEPPIEESAAQRQARLRREKRNAKIQNEGTDRLAKITQITGRVPPVETASPRQATAAPDPDEVDISEHHWTPPTRSQQIDTLRAQQNRTDPFSEFRSNPVSADGAADGGGDPMMQMMQQMLAGGMPGMGGDPNDPNAPNMPDLPPMLRAMMGGQQQADQEAAMPKSDTTYLWRILHAVFALSLGVYIALTTTFNGSKLSRTQIMDEEAGPRLFYIFATAELVLQSTRYFLEKGQLKGSGWLATIANSGMVPHPYGHYLKVLGRYMTIWQTIVGDATTVVFVLGLLAWWKGMATA